MQQLKKISFYIFIAISLIMAVWGYFKLIENKTPTTSITEHISKDVNYVLITNNADELMSQLTRQNLIWNSLIEDQSLKKINESIFAFDSIIKIDYELAELFKNNPLYQCFYKTDKAMDYLMILKLKEKSNKSIIKSFFEPRCTLNSNTQNELGYIFKLKNNTFYIGYDKGIIYISLNKQLIEKAAQLVLKESLAKDSEFNDYVKLNGKQQNIIYINKPASDLFSSTILQNKGMYQASIKPDNITLNGFVKSTPLIIFFKNQQANIITVFEKLPEKPSTIIGISFNDAFKYQRLFEADLNLNETNIIQNAWKQINDSASFNLKKDFLENINNEISTNYYSGVDYTHRLTAIKIKDEELTEELLKIINDSSYLFNEHKIYQIKKPFKTIFSFIQSSDNNEFAVLNQNILILANNKSAIDFYFQKTENDLSIEKDQNMASYIEDNFSEACHVLHFNDLSLINHNTIEPKILNELSSIVKQKTVSKIAYTAKIQNNYLQLRLNALHFKKNEINYGFSTKHLWEYLADSTITTPVFNFINHQNNENELCFQTSNLKLQLVSSTGNLIWNKKINEPIKSSIYTVDIFKNGKLQLLFNTENYLHLIDRNGNYVQGYPIKTPSKITSNITLLDYDKNKDYRILISCYDKKIYNYTLYGIKTEGFVPYKTSHEVTLPIKYIKVGLSDYLIAIDIEGNIYGFSRKGDGRILLNNHTITHLSNFDILLGNTINNTKIIYVDDSDNLLNKISLTDKKETLKLGDEITGFNSYFETLNDDNLNDIICFGDGAIFGYDMFSNKLFEKFETSALYKNIQLSKSNSKVTIIAYDKAGNKIDILETNGKIKNSFQHVSSPPLIIDLYHNGTKYLIYSFDNKLICSALN